MTCFHSRRSVMCSPLQLVKTVVPGKRPTIEEDDSFTKSKRKDVSVNKEMLVIKQDRSWKAGPRFFGRCMSLLLLHERSWQMSQMSKWQDSLRNVCTKVTSTWNIQLETLESRISIWATCQNEWRMTLTKDVITRKARIQYGRVKGEEAESYSAEIFSTSRDSFNQIKQHSSHHNTCISWETMNSDKRVACRKCDFETSGYVIYY